MNRTILHRMVFLVQLALGSNALFGQQLPNVGFEDWEQKTLNGVQYLEPQGWFTLNALKAFGYEESTFESSDAMVGKKAVMLETLVGQFNTIPGLLTLKSILGENGMPNVDNNRIPFQHLPAGISFYYKSGPEIGDTNVVFMLLSKWNNGKRDTIGIASFEIGSAVDKYTYAVVPTVYFINNELPDSMSFIVSSSKNGFSPIAGSWFLVDQLQLFYTDGFQEQAGKRLKLYPNPASEMMNIDGLNKDMNFNIYNLLGETVLSGSTVNSKVFGLNQLNNGNYILHLYNNAGQSYHHFNINN
jgi:hypothetical protein